MTTSSEFVRVGRHEIPFYTFVEGPIKSRDIVLRYRNDFDRFTKILYYDKEETAMVLPEDLSQFRYSVVRKKIEDNVKANAPQSFTNGPNYGCLGVHVLDGESDYQKIMLDLRPTWFYDHFALGISLNQPLSKDGKITLKQYLIQNYKVGPLDWSPLLTYTCGNNVSIRSSDGYLILMNRGKSNVQNPERIGIPAGFGDHRKDLENGAVSPRMTAVREAGEESGAGAEINPDRLVLRHVGRPEDDWHTEISWSLDSEKKADELLQASKGKYEGKLFKVAFNLSEDTMKFLRDPSRWVLAHWYDTIQVFAEEFGREKLIEKLNA